MVLLSVDFKNSETKKNLMRAFSGESQARNRYCMAAGQAKQQKLQVLEFVFKFTANQEEEHAKIFYKHLSECAGETIEIDGSYPVDINEDIAKLLRYAEHNEFEEYDDVYKAFADKAKEEGFENIAYSFKEIGEIEKIHGERFAKFADLLEKNELFVSNVECKWMCLNCGNVLEAKEAPMTCPVCQHDRGYYVRLELAPYSC